MMVSAGVALRELLSPPSRLNIPLMREVMVGFFGASDGRLPSASPLIVLALMVLGVIAAPALGATEAVSLPVLVCDFVDAADDATGDTVIELLEVAEADMASFEVSEDVWLRWLVSKGNGTRMRRRL
jgi:hypothetical protein